MSFFTELFEHLSEARESAELKKELLSFGLDPENKSVAEMEAMLAAVKWTRDHPNEEFPEQITPMLAGDASKMPVEWLKTVKDTDWWVQEKMNGMRSILSMKPGKVIMTSRTKSVTTNRYEEHQDKVPHFMNMKVPFEGKTVLDGELTSAKDKIDTGGTISSSKLQAAVAIVHSSPEKAKALQEKYGPLIYNCFDILWLNGKDVRDLPYDQRAGLAEKAVEEIQKANPGITLNSVPVIKNFADVADIFKQHTSKGAEGVMLKRRTMKYEPVRSKHMLKLKREMTVDGWISGAVRSDKYDAKGLIAGFEISSNVEGKGKQVVANITGIPNDMRADATILVLGNPGLNPTYLNRTVEVLGQEFTKSDKLVHARFEQWRPDKKPDECFVSKEMLQQPASESAEEPEIDMDENKSLGDHILAGQHPESTPEVVPSQHNLTEQLMGLGEDGLRPVTEDEYFQPEHGEADPYPRVFRVYPQSWTIHVQFDSPADAERDWDRVGKLLRKKYPGAKYEQPAEDSQLVVYSNLKPQVNLDASGLAQHVKDLFATLESRVEEAAEQVKYKCSDCGHEFQAAQRKDPDNLDTVCPKCDAGGEHVDLAESVNEGDTSKIKAKHPGILKVPDGKKFYQLPVDHYIKLSKSIGKPAVMRALLNQERWNKNKNPGVSAKARSLINRLKKSPAWTSESKLDTLAERSLKVERLTMNESLTEQEQAEVDELDKVTGELSEAEITILTERIKVLREATVKYKVFVEVELGEADNVEAVKKALEEDGFEVRVDGGVVLAGVSPGDVEDPVAQAEEALERAGLLTERIKTLREGKRVTFKANYNSFSGGSTKPYPEGTDVEGEGVIVVSKNQDGVVTVKVTKVIKTALVAEPLEVGDEVELSPEEYRERE